LKKRRLIRVTEIIEAAASKPCVMCQHPATSVGLFIPNDSTEVGAEPVKTAIHQQKLQA
jgi:hypothetical protein